MIDLACALLSVALLCWSMITRPTAARCYDGYYVASVDGEGVYGCQRAPGGDPLYDGADGYPDRTVDRPGWYLGRIWCTGGSQPIVVIDDREARSVGCQR